MTILLIIMIALAIIGGLYLKYFVPLRKIGDAFDYVYVELDGTVRELEFDEKKYLSEEFHPNDGDRPYIKAS